MAYTVNQIKLAAYNCSEQPDYTVAERNLFIGLAYCYEWFRLHPEDKEDCERLMGKYIEFYNLTTYKGE